MLTVPVAVQAEAKQARTDISREIAVYGYPLEFLVRNTQAQQTLDTYGTVKKKPDNTPTDLKAYPVTFSPNARQIEKAGLREECAVVVYTSALDWDNQNIKWEALDVQKTSVNLAGETFDIKEKGKVGGLANTILYYTFALVRR